MVDHGSGRLVWAAPGRDTATLTAFFDVLGEDRCALITHVSADGANWIANVLTVALFDDVGVMGRDDVGGFGNAPPGVSAGRSSSW